MGRSIGLDVHRDFCEVAIADGGRARSAGRVATTPEQLELFAQSLAPTDRVVLEATGNALAIARILEPHVARGRARARQAGAGDQPRAVKTDKVDAQGAGRAAGRRSDPGGVDRRRAQRGCCAGWCRAAAGWSSAARRSRTRSPRCCIATSRAAPPASDLFGNKGRAWLAEQRAAGRRAADRRRRACASSTSSATSSRRSTAIDRRSRSLGDDDVRRLMTIPGVDVDHRRDAGRRRSATSAASRPPRHLVGYLGLDPTRPPVRQRARPPRPDLQGGLGRRPPRARRGGLVGRQEPRPAARVRAAHRRPPRPARRDRRRRAQARRARLAPAHPRRGLRLRAPGARPRASCAALELAAGAPRRKPGPNGDPVWQHRQRRRRDATRRAGRGRLPAARRRLAGHAARRRVRARHRSAHLKGPRRARPRGRPQAPDACTSPRQSPAPTPQDRTRSPNAPPEFDFLTEMVPGSGR